MYSKPKRNIILNEKKYPKSYPLIIIMCILHVCAWKMCACCGTCVALTF